KGGKTRYQDGYEEGVMAHWQNVASKHLAELSIDSLARYAKPELVTIITDSWRQKVLNELTKELGSSRLYEADAELLAVMLSGLVLMDPIRTGHMIDNIYNNPGSCRGYDAVKPETARRRLAYVVQKVFKDWPAL